MKAIVFEKYGPPEVLQVEEVDTPRPKDNEVRVAVVPAENPERVDLAARGPVPRQAGRAPCHAMFLMPDRSPVVAASSIGPM